MNNGKFIVEISDEGNLNTSLRSRDGKKRFRPINMKHLQRKLIKDIF